MSFLTTRWAGSERVAIMLQQKMKINLCERSCVPPPLALAPISFSLIGRASCARNAFPAIKHVRIARRFQNGFLADGRAVAGFLGQTADVDAHLTICSLGFPSATSM
jgi:hypothetical protein